MLTRALALLTAVVGFAGGGAVSATAATTPIRHVVVIFDENVSFDHYFGTYPNAANPPGQPAFTPAPGTPVISGLSGALLTANPNGVNPFRLDRTQAVTCDNDHSYTDEQRAFDGGLMDKFTAVVSCGGAASTGMGYYDGNTVTALWNYAQHYAMSDAHFGTTFGPSTPGALNLISGQTHPPAGATLISDPDPAGDDCGAGGATFGGAPNIGTLLSAVGVTWGWFEGGFRPTSVSGGGVASCNAAHQNVSGATVRDYSPHHEPFQYYDQTRNPHHKAPSSVAAIGHDEAGVNHQYDLSDYFAALDAGTPPAVSFLKAPAYQDGHAGYSDPLDEQRFLVDTVNRIQASSTWGDTAIVITYDDSDGWYDHQPSPIVNSSSGPDDALDGPGQCHGSSFPPMAGGFSNRCGFGPRLPLLVVSPYAKVNHVDHTQIDQTSVLRFIEDNWGTGQLGGGSFDDIPSPKPTIDGLLDFTRTAPAAPLRLDPATGNPPVPTPPAPPTPPASGSQLPVVSPSATPTPTAPARRAARRLSARVRHARDRRAPFSFALSGTLTPPAGMAKQQACRGSVTVVVKVGARTALRRHAKLHASCRWSLRATLKHRHGLGHGRLTVRVRFGGNALVRPRSARALHLRAG